jgi:Ser-tRNA(Ala) deacylase AlaX
MINTHLKYLDDTYAIADNGIVLRTGRDDRGAYIVLDQTIFYPQGGGQPTDTGFIQSGETVMNVSFVGFSDGEVLHYITEEPPHFDALVGQSCELHVDKLRRLHHAKLHTAGHVIAGIIDARRGSMRAVKGFHFDDGPYVEFEGKQEGEAESFLATLQTQIDALINENPAVTAALLTYDELKQRCWNIPSNMPEDKPLRTVTIGQLDASPCGGTHIASLAEIETIFLLKIKSKKGNTKISYRVGNDG